MEKPRKSVLMTPDPYHTPGYAGYVPQFKYRIGSTYGCHTHEILCDNAVRKSTRSVLSETWPPRRVFPPLTDELVQGNTVLLNNRSWGNQKYTPQMIPGYTGFIPKGQNYFGCRYAESSRYAINSFENDQQRCQAKMDELQTLSQQQENDDERKNFTIAQNTTPLMPIAEKPQPFLPAYSKRHSTSPFALPYGHPDKHFMSGYMGFVPRLEKYFAQGYPINTKRALVEFAEDGMRLQESQEKPFTVELPTTGEQIAPTGQSMIYPKSTGLIPHYTGHIPGQKFKFSKTFGSSTRDALPQITA